MANTVIQQALELVNGQIAKRLHTSVAKLRGAAVTLRDLAVAGERLAKSWDGMQEIPDEFKMGIVEVLNVLDAFVAGGGLPQSHGHGLASNNEAVQTGTVHQSYLASTEIAGVSKASESVKNENDAIAFFDAHFVPAMKNENDVNALGALRIVRDTLQKDWAVLTATVTAPTSIEAVASPAIPATEPNAALVTSAQDSVQALQAANSGAMPALREASVDHAVTPSASIEAIQASTGGSTSSSIADNTVSTQKAAPIAPVTHIAPATDISWPRDMARKGHNGATSPALASAAAAVVKSDEPVFAGWPADMAPRSRR